MDTPKQTPVTTDVNAAERDKYIAETEKAKAERLKIDFDYQEALKESKKKWWQTKNFRQQLLTASVGVTLIGFYITFVIEPGSKIDNLNAQINNLKVTLLNTQNSSKLALDSVKFGKEDSLLKRQQILQFYLRKSVSEKNRRIDVLKDSINQISARLQRNLFVIRKYSATTPKQAQPAIVTKAISNLESIDLSFTEVKKQSQAFDSIVSDIKQQNSALDKIDKKTQNLEYLPTPIDKFPLRLYVTRKPPAIFYDKYAIRLNEVNKHGDFVNIDLLSQKGDNFEQLQNVDINRLETKTINLPDGSLSLNISVNALQKAIGIQTSADFIVEVFKKKQF